ncbi:uncharacterized protein A4U43_C08F27990 [Asparagus officinalis]|nr:uncharacterized protein A4U43_C08F27990 [Asparagus officinalis]
MKNPNPISSDLNLKNLISTRGTKLFAYGFIFSFIGCTAFLAFNPSNNSSSPWFHNLFSSPSTSSLKASIAPYRSQVSSLFSHFFPNSSSSSASNRIERGGGSWFNGGSRENRSRDGLGSQGFDAGGIRVLGKNQTTSSIGSKANGMNSEQKDHILSCLRNIWEMPAGNGTKETLRLDIIERSSSKYKDAHAIIFNTGHWWTHEKTSKGKDYYQEGNKVYSELNVVDAFHKALNTWAKWIDTNVNPNKSFVFFRGYSASHFRGGQWNSGGACDKETEPIKKEEYLSSYPSKMSILESVIKGMRTPVVYLNITRMTDYRKDAHPSVYRKKNLSEEERKDPLRFQDCSHWCLPGVPDSWNELLYAQLIIKQYQMAQKVG